MSQADYFLKVDGAPGESMDDKHKDEIECISFGFGCSQTGSAAYGKGLGAGKVSMQDFSFVMKANKAGPMPALFYFIIRSAAHCRPRLNVHPSGPEL